MNGFWERTKQGNLVNLAHATLIQIEERNRDAAVVAYLGHRDETGFVLWNDGNEEEARKFLRDLHRSLIFNQPGVLTYE